ncbi:MAG TPA: isocitrate/isopropylmalate family dehydrogenase [Thermoanaerobaculia bacterium]
MAPSRVRVTLIRGDGIGPEVVDAALAVLEAAGAPLEFEEAVVGRRAEEAEGDPLPARVVESIRRNRVALKAPVETPVGRGFSSVNVRLRKTLELYANLRPVHTVPGVPARYTNVDLIVIRENTEDLYSGLEHTVVPGVVESLKIITEAASTRIARFAFEYARRERRRRVTAIHKANIMKLSDGLFLDCFHRVAAEYPEITSDDKIVDTACMRLVMNPEAFDVLLLENLYGDIVSDLAAGLVGGLGLVPGANLGKEATVFEAVHGTAPDIAGTGRANPTALLMSAVLMLRHVDLARHADAIERALLATFAAGIRTSDLGGAASTTEFAREVAARVG